MSEKQVSSSEDRADMAFIWAPFPATFNVGSGRWDILIRHRASWNLKHGSGFRFSSEAEEKHPKSSLPLSCFIFFPSTPPIH